MAQLREWLEARGLGRYADALLAQDIELDILPELTDADLTAAGLPVGARKRLLQAIEGLRNLADPAMQSKGAPTIAPTTEPATEAERRQLTVLFCDVVGSTHLAETLDAEDLRNLLLSFQKVCAEVVQRHEGQIGLFIGDGVTAYFGYPRAHEDSAQRAVQAGWSHGRVTGTVADTLKHLRVVERRGELAPDRVECHGFLPAPVDVGRGAQPVDGHAGQVRDTATHAFLPADHRDRARR